MTSEAVMSEDRLTRCGSPERRGTTSTEEREREGRSRGREEGESGRESTDESVPEPLAGELIYPRDRQADLIHNNRACKPQVQSQPRGGRLISEARALF